MPDTVTSQNISFPAGTFCIGPYVGQEMTAISLCRNICSLFNYGVCNSYYTASTDWMKLSE
jgi:hypothetical protein